MEIIFLFLVFIIISSFVFTGLFLAKPNLKKLNAVHRIIIKQLIKKWDSYLNSLPVDEHVIVNYKELMKRTNFVEHELANRILHLPAEMIGFKGPFYSFERPKKFIKIESKKFTSGRESGVQYATERSYSDFLKMQEMMADNIGKKIFIDSGYRSPGRQAFLFIKYLASENNFSIFENAKWIALPGYSEHGHPEKTAYDFSTEDGVNGFSKGQKAEDFEKTDEYKWLLENAAKFNFYLSYPKNNKHGVAFEPWHWHWEKKN